MDRGETETLLREMYARRLDNDLENCIACFAPSASFEICGSNDASPIPCHHGGTTRRCAVC